MKRFIVLLTNPAPPPEITSAVGQVPHGQRLAPGACFGRLHRMGGAELYGGNTAEMWASLAPWSRVSSGPAAGLVVVDIPAQRATRVILRQPLAADSGQVGSLMRRAAERGRVVVEDSFGGLALPVGGGITVDRYPLMIRPPAAIEPLPSLDPRGAGAAGNGARVRVVPAADREALAQAERVIVDGFPRRALQPFRPECMLPPLVLTIPGWRTWLAYHDGEPAAECCTFDDGAALGVNWLATLPEHRFHGLGRAVMCAALGDSAQRPAVLVATAAGEPLYSSLGFRTVTEAAWYRSPGPENPALTGRPGPEAVR
jgi:GNAT superfamily N-acetyltransferase